MSKYKLKKSGAPLVAVGVFWVLYALLFPLYRWYDFIVPVVLTPVVNFIFARIFPPVKVEIIEPYKLPQSGVAEVDAVITEADATIKSIESSAMQIALKDNAIAADTEKLVSDARGIITYVAENSQKAQSSRKLFNYYLPTLDKLLKNYIVFDTHGSDTQNAATGKAEIAAAVHAMKDVFKSQREKLLDDVAIDNSAEIDVLETMLDRTNIGK